MPIHETDTECSFLVDLDLEHSIVALHCLVHILELWRQNKLWWKNYSYSIWTTTARDLTQWGRPTIHNVQATCLILDGFGHTMVEYSDAILKRCPARVMDQKSDWQVFCNGSIISDGELNCFCSANILGGSLSVFYDCISPFYMLCNASLANII